MKNSSNDLTIRNALTMTNYETIYSSVSKRTLRKADNPSTTDKPCGMFNEFTIQVIAKQS